MGQAKLRGTFENPSLGGSALNGGLGVEPDMDSQIGVGYSATWAMKKASCIYEARIMWETGRYSLEDNPFNNETWPHKWWADEYNACDA